LASQPKLRGAGQAGLKMWNVYILRSAVDKNLYVGSTDNIGRRLTEHNSGKVDSTKSRAPFSLEAYFAVKDKSIAIELEQYFKTGSGRAFLQKRIL
jgi:predicted GIY-YIG superfamily endonuclease